nr:DUF4397 domain-containing protein [Vibrio sonorensis]
MPNQDSNADSPVKLVVLDGSSSSIIFNMSEKAEIEVGHLVSDVNIVDVGLDGSEAISNVDYKGLTGYTTSTTLTPKAYAVTVYPDNTPASPVINETVTFAKGGDYGVFAVGKASTTIEALVVETYRRPVATSATLNVIHGAPDASTVDVYLTSSTDISSATPAISSFNFKDATQGVYVAAGTYFVTVTPTGTKTAAIGPASITVENDKVYQAIAIEEDEDVNPSTFDLLVSEIQD